MSQHYQTGGTAETAPAVALELDTRALSTLLVGDALVAPGHEGLEGDRVRG